MDKVNVSLSVPATIYNIGETQDFLTKNQYVTKAKLKVFYVGKTGDNRVFTQEFSDQLLQTLPGTPVVAYYDEERDDFVGHNYVQYVFGYVPETASLGYITDESGVRFAVTDVLLFTGRNDNIGEVASKILGKSHSLELDPATVEYTIVRAGGQMESITFTKGDFIGLSVLGDNEQPAFSGSAFFSEHDDDLQAFVNSFQEFKKEVELYKSGGNLMNDENNLPIQENEPVIEEAKEISIKVTIEEEDELQPGEEVVETTQEITEIVKTNSDGSQEVITTQTIEQTSETMMEELIEEVIVEEIVEAEEIVEEISEVVVEAQTLEGMEDVRETKEEVQGEVEISNSAALNNAERQELNEYRKKAKFEIIEVYSDLDEEILNKYRENHAEFTVEQLDKELAYELVKSQRQNKKNGVKVFSLAQETPKEDTLQDVIARYKDKK